MYHLTIIITQHFPYCGDENFGQIIVVCPNITIFLKQSNLNPILF